MGGAPVIDWVRDGVGYAPDAAASMRRLEAALGRPHDSNSSYRDYSKQESMWKAWEAWVGGRGPKPPHSRAIAPWLSKHCMGLGDDSDDWVTPGYIALAEEHGWIRTAANDPTERHHFEYQWWRDQHRNDPTPATTEPREDIMANIPPLAKQSNSTTIWALNSDSKKYQVTPAQMSVYKKIAAKLGLDINDYIAEDVALSEIPNR